MLRALALAPLALLTVVAAPALAQESPAPTPTPCDSCTVPRPTTTPPSDRVCATPLVVYPGGGVAGGQQARISIGFDTDQSAPSATYTVSLVRRSPAPFGVVRTAQTSATGTVFTVRLGETHGFVAEMRRNGEECVFGGGTVDLTVPVTPSLGLSAVRRAPREYSFAGRVLPGRGQAVTLYRVVADGTRVITSRTTVRPDGTYRIDRRFTGSGRFGFVASVGESATNLAGSSPERPTVVH